MDDYAGRVLADRYRLPLPASDEYELTETPAFDTYSGQEVLVRQVPLPEVVEAEVLDAEGHPEGFTARDHAARRPAPRGRPDPRRNPDPAVRRAVDAVQAVARIPDHPRLDQVFDVFAEGGSLWIVSEAVAARSLAELLGERPLTPYRAAEVASDVLTALRVLHAHGWVHRNVTARTVLVCDDGRVLLTGLAAGAAEEALCGYDPVPALDDGDPGPAEGTPPASAPNGVAASAAAPPSAAADAASPPAGPLARTAPPRAPGGAGPEDAEAARRAAIQARVARTPPVSGGGAADGAPAALAPRPAGPGEVRDARDVRAARAGAIAAYRAGARAAARVQEAQPGQTARQDGRTALPGGRPAVGPDPRHPDERPRSPLPPSAAPAPGSAPALPAGWAAAPDGAAPGTRLGPVPAPAAPGETPAGGSGPGGDTAGRHGPGPSAAVEVSRPRQPAGWDAPEPGATARRGPTTALAAERARQARMTLVGAVTERWAPEQAGPVHDNWQLAAPIGPATDLWALGALLFRSVQGHAPYPEESTAELVQMVCAEPPAFAEECGPLRPVVESLLRQDPTERPDVEELRGWLRSLVRSAPEPDAGAHIVSAPPADTGRLPILRRRGELVRRRRAGLPATNPHGRHKRARNQPRSPRRLGRALLLLVLLGLAAAVAYAMLFMPRSDREGAAGAARAAAGAADPVGSQPAPGGGDGPGPSASGHPSADSSSSTGDSEGPSSADGSTQTQTNGAELPDGFTLRDDPAGFRVAVANGWTRAPKNGSGQVVYTHGHFELIVVPGRDGTDAYGSDPMVYQREHERELQPYRASSWATATGLKTIQVGGRTMAEGQFTWTGTDGRELFVRNLALLIDGRYHVVQVRGPEAERDEVTRLYEQAAASYRPVGRAGR
ncbi:protein kinase [Streptomyces sp. MS06]|uniref:protein kinase n=1 Tax=Streptomyces sp. MS06 TaxID=3385974 RepID=UPI0039A29018